jgi:hypothetical protein
MITYLADQVESTIRCDVPPLASQLGDDVVWPRYDGYSIANLPATFASILGAQMPMHSAPPLPAELWRDLARNARRIVFVLMDALGYRRFCRALEAEAGPGWRPLVERGRFFPLTSVFPSTTVAALSSLWTGLAPSQHGYLGTFLFLREYGAVAQMISLKLAVKGAPEQLVGMGLEPEKFLPAPNVVEVFKSGGVSVYDVTPYHLARGGLTRILHRGVDRNQVVPFVAASDMWVRLRRLLDAECGGDQPMYVYAYHAPLDGISHLYGPADEALDAELRAFAYSMRANFLDRLSPQAAKGTLLVISADHGQVVTPKPSAIVLHKQPVWQDLVMMPTAEARAAYAYVRAGRMQAVRDALTRDLPGKLVAVDTRQALDAGLWGPGPLHSEALSRLGDLLLLATGDGYLADSTGQMPEFLGMHGGLTAEEMLVPSLWLRLDE